MRQQNVLIVHNKYRSRGGEEAVVEAEAELLKRHGHDVRLLLFDNESIRGQWETLAAGLSAVWSFKARATLNLQIREQQPDVVHFHNMFPLVSPSVYSVCHDAGAAVVQTLHNYRLMCANGQLLRSGRPCTDCVGKHFQWPGIVHNCYRDRAATSAVVAMNTIHWTRRTWETQVDRFIALTQFARSMFVKAGLPADRIDVKPNFAYFQSRSLRYDHKMFLYAGRLSPEKGIDTLLAVFRERPQLNLVICGDGPLAPRVRDAAAHSPNVRWLGLVDGRTVAREMRGAAALVLPSQWFEGFPMVVAEAFSHGLPVITTLLGGLGELVENDISGYLVPSGDVAGLGDAMASISNDTATRERLSRGAYSRFIKQYSPQRNYRRLLRTYAAAQAQANT